jgi:phage terminase large subunit
LRREGSELWFSWNPRYKTDPIDKFLRKNPPPDSIVVSVNWRDNPWFPDVLRKEMEHDFTTDPDKAEHIWNGGYGSSQGAILAKWVNEAEREGRIHSDVVLDPHGAPVEVSSDIGFRDTASWWYWQRSVGGYSLLKYEGDTGLDADDWIPRIQKSLLSLGVRKPGKIWLPQDAKAKTFQSKHTSVEKFLAAFGGDRVDIVPPSKKPDQISAAREVIKRCAFHRELCEEGLDGLRAGEFEYNDDSGVFSREPVHNWASHPGDSYSYGCQIMQLLDPPKEEKNEPIRGLAVGPTNAMTMDEAWKLAPKPNGRI